MTSAHVGKIRYWDSLAKDNFIATREDVIARRIKIEENEQWKSICDVRARKCAQSQIMYPASIFGQIDHMGLLQS